MTIRRLTLIEFTTAPGVYLTISEREALRQLNPGLRVEPTPYATDRYDLTPDQRIGLIALQDVVVEIRPKIPISAVLFLVSYSCDATKWYDEQPEFGNDVEVVEAVAVMLARLVEQATRRGLLNGYQTKDESVHVPRGRILIDEQLRRRWGIAPPIEVRHDDFTADNLENRILLGALATLSQMPLRSQTAKRELLRAQRLFGAVSRLRFSPKAVPPVTFTRLNRHYLPAVSLSTLVLRSGSLDLGTGGARGSALLIDMNLVFERFVRTALRHALQLDTGRFPERAPPLRLDGRGIIPLKPDLCLIHKQRIAWVGDAKYKRLPSAAYTNADLYQLLAYTVALDLQSGTLVYAADDGVKAATHFVVQAGKRLKVVALDLRATRAAILGQIASLATEIKTEANM